MIFADVKAEVKQQETQELVAVPYGFYKKHLQKMKLIFINYCCYFLVYSFCKWLGYFISFISLMSRNAVYYVLHCPKNKSESFLNSESPLS